MVSTLTTRKPFGYLIIFSLVCVSFPERWSKFGVFGYGPGELQYPCYVSTNTEGHIYVSDMHSNKIHVSHTDKTILVIVFSENVCS